MHQKHFEAAMLLAGLEYTNVYTIENGYCGNDCCPDKPWFLFKTKYGLIKIGWRKRVINLDWEDTPLRAVITEENNTKGETFVHCWGYFKLVEYLTVLSRKLKDRVA